MIKRLRIKFVCINMVLVMVMLTLILVMVYHFTGQSLERTALNAMQAAELSRPGRPGFMENGAASMPCFTLSRGPGNEIIVTGSEYYDLSDQALLLQILQAAEEEEEPYGKLERYALRYYRSHSPVGERYVFSDMSGEQATLANLARTGIFIEIIGFFGFLGISVALAFWAVRPVEQAWKQQRQFVADASHELKTPLTVILTNAELLQDPGYEAADRRQFTESILTMARQMRGLVENLLELARVDNGQLKLVQSRLELSKLAEEAVLPFEPVYFEQGLGLEVRVEPGIWVTGSGQHLRQVMEILLDNGCKYCAPGGTAELSLVKQGHGKCLLAVTTPGQTLTAQQCRDIFKRFYRVDEARTGCGSYGLGLPIAQQIVQQHRGKIWAQGKDGKNTFFVQLPEG